MSLLQALVVLVAGVAAGTINTVVGSGTLITFPVLLAVGYPPLTANVSNCVGLATGAVSGVYGYRRELVGQRARMLRWGTASMLGACTGAGLLFVLPDSAFEKIVPGMIALALVMVALQPRLARAQAARRKPQIETREGGPVAYGFGYLTGVYGGYFGAAQGIVLMAILGLAIDEDVQRINALKNVMAMVVNVVAATIFIVVAHIEWEAVGLLAVGSTVGGQLGARIGRRLPPNVLRIVIVVVGVAAIVQLLAR
ncbi:sulfite exporter TauE/SafE family protein [Conexibacter sp. CPCC 206217]|uniref:sulfite exporter TauE/SafE family protein n=1 Tax=Conexibacter sp. CPCC 206217 TaxID=3064574 RepID=UPI002724F17A|nr:sulfite exporter TauE/SafE family protein [Conexibacter sp. CPCC 206217]MDO8213505.1 sulfite exporter TauE/SafE family protein [Conexibacter sp. CPCC 206217]